MNTTSPIFGRLAPSPTGAQHVGNARTYLIAWLSARSQNGRVVLRIEDIDASRAKPGAAESACEDLRWLGLEWDDGPIVQTTRLAFHEAALERLKALELVYPCICTRADIDRAASAPHLDQESPNYPGTCAHRRVADALTITDRPFAWRMRFGTETIPFEDVFRGATRLSLLESGGDFVVWKPGGTPAYQLAVVVDDADANVTEVIRGDDLVTSTPRQVCLYRALGRTPPRFAHVPLVYGHDGRRLAKRHGDLRIQALREAGVSPSTLLGLLAWSCGWLERIEPITLAELLPRFSLESIPREPFVLTRELLAQIGYRG